MELYWPGPADGGLGAEVPPSGRSLRYLCFTLSGKPLATDATRVREMMPTQPLVDFPDPKPTYLLGGIYLRGRVVPVVDLAAKLGLTAAHAASKGYLFMREVGPRPDDLLIGFLVHRITDIVEAKESDLPGARQVRVKGRTRRLLSLDGLFQPAEMEELRRLLR